MVFRCILVWFFSAYWYGVSLHIGVVSCCTLVCFFSEYWYNFSLHIGVVFRCPLCGFSLYIGVHFAAYWCNFSLHIGIYLHVYLSIKLFIYFHPSPLFSRINTTSGNLSRIRNRKFLKIYGGCISIQNTDGTFFGKSDNLNDCLI